MDSLAVSCELLSSKRIVESSLVQFGPHGPHEQITQWHVLNKGRTLIALLFIPSECIFELQRDILEIHLSGLLNDGKLHDVSERDKYYQTAANVQYKLTPLCIYK